jgi:lipopolysaccharide transport system ATP-binding protein
MSKPAIRVENLGKRYLVDHEKRLRGGYGTLREALVNLATAPVRRLRGEESVTHEEFWALKDVSFEVQPGEVVGIVGRNGAGKSTLLKILSQITKPTTGSVELHGRVGSLLEVGTGFHPELTGRENIYLNGSILGMSRREIDGKFDEIVDFAEIEKFLDTPVKRYSSGMYVRLAFAVAAHLEPEMLLVDEVLAVGDIGFQNKCLGRMRDVSRGGRTVIFVSHNMGAVESLCDRAALFEDGRLVSMDETRAIIERYYERHNTTEYSGNRKGGQLASRQGIVHRAVLLDERGRETAQVALGDLFHLKMSLLFSSPVRDPVIGLGIDDAYGNRMLTLHTPLSNDWSRNLHGNCVVDSRVASFPLAPGQYRIKISVSAQTEAIDVVDNALCFAVIDRDAFCEGRRFHAGVCVAPCDWTLSNSNLSA